MKVTLWARIAVISLLATMLGFSGSPAHASVNQSELPTTLGTDFFIAFSGQTGTLRAIYLSSTENATATIQWPDGTTQSSQIAAGLVQTIDATAKVGVQASGTESTNNQTVRITSDVPISVYYINYRSFTTDASSAIPVASLGTEYVVMSYRPSYTANSEKSRLNIIATAQGTTSVTITPSVDLVGGRAANQPFTKELSQGQVFSTIGNVSDADLSGSIVESDKPISVMTSTYLNTYLISGTSRAADNIFEEMIPVAAWDRNYVLAMSPGYATNQRDLYRVFASQDGTVLEVNGNSVGTLNRGEWYEFDSSNTGARADIVSASSPVGVMQFLRGSSSGYRATPTSAGTDGDPAMIAVPSATQHLADYVITTPASGFTLNMLVLVAPVTAKGQITLDGTTIPESSFTDIPSTSYAVARVEISLGAHYIRGSEPFGLSVMGFTSADSYAYSGGFGVVTTPGGYAAALNNAPPTAPFAAGGDTLSGSGAICSTLSITEGTWTDGRSPILSTTYRWLRNGQTITGATSSSYTVSAADAGSVVSAEVSKTNAIGTTVALTSGLSVLDLRLANLSSSVGTLAPTLTDCGQNYSLVTSASSIVLTAGATDSSARVRANLIEFQNGGSTVPIALSLGSNTITLDSYQGNVTFSRTIEVVRSTNPVVLQTDREIGQTSIQIESTLFPNLNTVSSMTIYVAADSAFTSGVLTEVLSSADFSGSGSITRSSTITGLTAGTTYFTKTTANFSGGVAETATVEFMTLAAPNVETVTSSQVTSSSAKLTLFMNSQSQTINFVGFDYSLDSSLETGTTRVAASYDNFAGPPARYAVTIDGLPAGKPIYFRAIGSNTTGTNSGVIKSFTLTAAPEGTVSASVSATNVDFLGEIDSFGSRTTQVVVRYGKTSGLLSSYTDLSLTPSIIESADSVSSSGRVTNLDPSTTYYAQLRVTSGVGSFVGPEFSFVTGAVPTASVQILAPTTALKTDVLNLFFQFSEPVTGFTKAGVSISGDSSGWTTQPVRVISTSLYSMEIRPSTVSTGSLVVEIANGAASTSARTRATLATSVSITISSVLPTTFSYTTLSLAGQEGQPLTLAAPSVGGAIPSLFSATPALPSGLSIDSSGAITGTPANGTAGQTSHVIRALGGSGIPSVTLTLSIAQGSGFVSGQGVGNPSSTPMVSMEITSLSKRVLSVSGGEVIAFGKRLSGIAEATLGGLSVTIVSNTATTLIFKTGEMPVGTWDLKLVGANGTLIYQSAIEVIDAPIISESTGELIGWSWTLRFLGNERSIHKSQEAHLVSVMQKHLTAETVICWGYTTAINPKPWAITHAFARAEAACDQVLANNPKVKTIVRLRYGVAKDFAMRAALQFWK